MNPLPVVMTGSHLDTQPTGGKFDGVYGVLAGLEVIESLNDHALTNAAPDRAVRLVQRGGQPLFDGDDGIGRMVRTLCRSTEALKLTDRAGISVQPRARNARDCDTQAHVAAPGRQGIL